MPKTTFSIKEIKNPLSIAMNYVIRNYGTNIIPNKFRFDKEENKYYIKLNAIIPNEISPIKKSKKKVTYFFKDVGEIILNENLNLVEKTPSQELERNIFIEFDKINLFIEEVIKKYGSKNWGRLNYIRHYLNPLYSIINQILVDNELDKNQLINNDYHKYIIPFINNDIIKEDPYKENKYIPGNYLNALRDKYDSQMTLTEITVGYVIEKSLDYIVNKLQISNFLAYIDLPKIYYLDALEYGEMIRIPYKDLVNKYLQFSRRNVTFKKEINFKLLISELTGINVLYKEPGKNIISGVDELFSKIMDFREDILANKSIEIEGLV
jgi:hypothetical protein